MRTRSGTEGRGRARRSFGSNVAIVLAVAGSLVFGLMPAAFAETNAPVVTNVTATPDVLKLGTNVTVTADVTDETGIASVEYLLDAGSWTAMALDSGSTYTVTLVSPGLGGHTVYVRATDTEATPNQSDGTANDTFTVNEATAPSVTAVTATPDPQGYPGNVEVSASVTDGTGIASVEYRLDAGSWTAMTLDSGSTYKATMVAPAMGAHTVYVRATDTVLPTGNVSDGAASDTFDVTDVTAPVVTNVTATPATQSYGGDVTVTADVTDDGTIATVEYSIDAGSTWHAMTAGTPPAYSATITKPDVDSYEVCVVATDAADNASDGTACDTFDVTIADSFIAFTGNAYNSSTTVRLEATVSGPCKAGRTVTFEADTGSGYASIGTADTNSAGVATLSYTGFSTGTIADVRVSVVATLNCTAAEGTGVIIVAGSGDASNGGGAYNNPGRINFGYALQVKTDRKTGTKTVSGQFLWQKQGEVRLKGIITGYVTGSEYCPVGFGGTSTCGLVTGSVAVYTWDGTDWIRTVSNVIFRMKVGDGGTSVSCTKKTCTTTLKPDWIQVWVPSNPGLAGTNATQGYQIKGGNIVVK